MEDIIKEKKIQIAPTKENREELNRVNAELKIYLKLEEAIWKQKAGLKWFTDGKRNTKFFHEYVKGRRRRLNVKENAR